MQQAARDVFKLKYALENEQEPKDTFARIAKALAAQENDPEKWESVFLETMLRGAIPAGRIISNAGAETFKPGTSTINCTVSETIQDSMEGIMRAASESAKTLAAGCGIGYEFSTLRPRGAYVSGAGAHTSGALSFMDIFDSMCFTVASAGGRRGAQMATFDIHHPDIEAFIDAKQTKGRFRQFNCSVLVTDDFMRAVHNNFNWKLSFPLRRNETAEETTWRPYPKTPEDKNYTRNNKGDVLCRVYKTIEARDLWNKIMRSTYDYAEPGILFIDQINKLNPLNWCEDLRATNPCGEQPLPPWGSCLLGSINLAHFVNTPFDLASFDWDNFSSVVKVFTRMLDNVVEINNLPLEQQRLEITHKRRHGMGITGLGSALTMLGIRYGSKEAQNFTAKVCQKMAIINLTTGIELAKEKGCAPIFKNAGYREHTLNTHYMKQIMAMNPDLFDAFKEHGSRFTHATSIAPTGTISLALGNNVSNGIEPTFAHHYKRNIIIEGKNTKEQQDVFSAEALEWWSIKGDKPMPDYAVTADQVTPKEHLEMQAAAQVWIDSSISKTINCPTNMPFEDFKNIYLDAWKLGVKGVTTYRFNPEGVGAVLMRNEDLKNQQITFKLADGNQITVTGDDQIEYEDAIHNAYNLYESIREGNYGKF